MFFFANMLYRKLGGWLVIISMFLQKDVLDYGLLETGEQIVSTSGEFSSSKQF